MSTVMITPHHHQVTEVLPDSKVYRNRKRVKSGNSGEEYVIAIRKSDARWTCSCKGWIFKYSKKGGDCDHIREIRERYGDTTRARSISDKLDALMSKLSTGVDDQAIETWITIKSDVEMLLLYYENENKLIEAGEFGAKVDTVRKKLLSTVN